MKKLSLITEFKESYKGSDLQKIVNNNPLPIKYTINDFDCYFYNADLFGLFEWKIQKDGITTNDFINDYQKGFEKGLLHLKEQEEIELKDLKSKDLREGTISQLKYILHEREFKLGSKGLLDLVFNEVPLIFTEKNIFDYGYWNGIIYSIDDIIKKAGLTLDELKTSEPQQTEKGAEENKDKEPPKKDTYLFEIGLKLALGELDEYLTFDKDGKRIGYELSYPEIAKIFNLDLQYLKCTLSLNIKSNPSKKLHNNPEIIEKVLTHLKSEGKEPKEWFLKEFKK